MNFKDRGITVGDLLIIFIIILTSIILIKSINKDKKSSINTRNFEKISYKTSHFENF